MATIMTQVLVIDGPKSHLHAPPFCEEQESWFASGENRVQSARVQLTVSNELSILIIFFRVYVHVGTVERARWSPWKVKWRARPRPKHGRFSSCLCTSLDRPCQSFHCFTPFLPLSRNGCFILFSYCTGNRFSYCQPPQPENLLCCSQILFPFPLWHVHSKVPPVTTFVTQGISM